MYGQDLDYATTASSKILSRRVVPGVLDFLKKPPLHLLATGKEIWLPLC
jgi:hypothetical protein